MYSTVGQCILVAVQRCQPVTASRASSHRFNTGYRVAHENRPRLLCQTEQVERKFVRKNKLGVVSKQLNIGSRRQLHTVAPFLGYMELSCEAIFSRGLTTQQQQQRRRRCLWQPDVTPFQPTNGSLFSCCPTSSAGGSSGEQLLKLQPAHSLGGYRQSKWLAA